MKYTNKQKTKLRKELKAAGYGCRINEKQSPFSDKILTLLHFILPDGHVVHVAKSSERGSNVYGSAFYRDHEVAFKIINNFIENERGE